MNGVTNHPSRITALLALYNNNLFIFVVVTKHHLDDLAVGGLNVLAHVIRLYRQLAVATIYQHRKLNPSRAAEIDQLIQRRAHGSTGVQHIVDQHDRAVGNVSRDVGFVYDRTRSNSREVVSIKRDVELSRRRTLAFELFDLVGYSFGERP